MEDKRKAVGVLKKVFDILTCFRLKQDMSLAEISHLAKINKSTAHRLLSQMVAEGFLQRNGDGRFQIGHSLFQIGILAPHPLELHSAAHSVMQELAADIGETVNLAILDYTKIMILNVVESQHEFRMAAKVGSRRLVHVTALGKAIVAFLPLAERESLIENLPMPLETPTKNSIPDLLRLRNELDLIRSRGYALDNEETVIGVQAVAAPIFSGKGNVEGSLSVSGPVIRITEERIASIMPSVVKAADTITSRLGGDPHIARLKARQPVEKDAETPDEVTNTAA